MSGEASGLNLIGVADKIHADPREYMNQARLLYHDEAQAYVADEVARLSAQAPHSRADRSYKIVVLVLLVGAIASLVLAIIGVLVSSF